MPTLDEAIARARAEIVDAEARLAAITGGEPGDHLYRAWLEDQLADMRRRLAATVAAANPPLGSV